MAEYLLTFFDKHFEDETTKGWVLSSLSKLYTVPGITTGDRIQEKFNKYKNSKFLDLQQRGIEYKYLSEYGSSSDVDYDMSLSFLDSYADLARRRGARGYDPDKKTRGLLTGLALTANTSGGATGEELKVTPYSQSEANKARPTQGAGETGIKVTSSKWTSKGFEDPKAESHINKNPQSFSANQSKSISSQDIQKGKIFPGFGKTESPTTFGGSGLGGGSYGQGSYASRPPQEDPAEKERKSTANALFAGLGGGKPTTTTGGFGGSTAPKTTTTTTANPFGIAPAKPTTTTTPFATTGKPQAANPFGLAPKTTTTTTTTTVNKPTTTTTAPASNSSSNIDLLDLDFGVGTTTTQPTTQPVKTGPSSGSMDLLGGNFGGAFGGAPVQQPSYVGKYTPVNLDLEFYEKYWGELPVENSENIPSGVKNVSDFRALLNKVNIGFVAEMEGEVLGAGKKGNGDFVLIYARIGNNGLLEVQCKSTSDPNTKEFLQSLREAAKK